MAAWAGSMRTDLRKSGSPSGEILDTIPQAALPLSGAPGKFSSFALGRE
jgi:hypothetical protein